MAPIKCYIENITLEFDYFWINYQDLSLKSTLKLTNLQFNFGLVMGLENNSNLETIQLPNNGNVYDRCKYRIRDDFSMT